MIICTIVTIIFALVFLLIIVLNKTCHTIPMILVANSCLTALVNGCLLLGMCAFTLQNDLKQIQFQNSFCIFRAYIGYGSCAALNYSFLLQAIYRYVTVVYPNRLFWQSVRFQVLLICLTWIFSFVYPTVFIFTDEVLYNINNQICQLRLRLSFYVIYMTLCVYTIPILLIIFIYFKLVRYVKEMSKRVASANILSRAQRELKMVRRTVILVMILFTICFPYEIFAIMSFFTSPPKYHFRIAYIFVDMSLVFVMIVLFQFTEPLKTSLMKVIHGRPNMVAARVA
jgi:hypothetical protein